jgi:hypothetical protein
MGVADEMDSLARHEVFSLACRLFWQDRGLDQPVSDKKIVHPRECCPGVLGAAARIVGIEVLFDFQGITIIILSLHRLQTVRKNGWIVFVSRGKKFLSFYSVEDVRQVSRGVFPARKPV